MKKTLATMMQNVDADDMEKTHDMLIILSEEVDKQNAQIEKLTKRLNRVNEALPSTAFPKKRGQA